MCYGKQNNRKRSNKGGFIIKHYITNNLSLLPLCEASHNGSLLIDWDNGCGLNVVYGEDVIRKISD